MNLIGEEDEDQYSVREADTTRKCLDQAQDSALADHISKVINFKSNLKKINLVDSNLIKNKIINSVSNSSISI